MPMTVMTTLLHQLSPSQQFTIHHLNFTQNSYVLTPLSLVDAHLWQLRKKAPKWLTRGWGEVFPAMNGISTIVNNTFFSVDWNNMPASRGDGYSVLQTVGVHPHLKTNPMTLKWLRVHIHTIITHNTRQQQIHVLLVEFQDSKTHELAAAPQRSRPAT